MTYTMSRAIGAYHKAAVAVPPVAAVTLLFDEVLNSLIMTARHLRAKEYDQAHLRSQRAVGILKGLRQNLDMETGGALAQQLLNTYTTNIAVINSVTRKPEPTEQLVKLAIGLVDLRNAWAEATSLSERSGTKLVEDIREDHHVSEVA
ncbi:flagellar protein FliS [Roseibium algae]|uniref:Flagellar protein FliS n=1 Tax=Roseibium algae TaxID=3123038 RepID=A0ABU8TEK4_9HYPH